MIAGISPRFSAYSSTVLTSTMLSLMMIPDMPIMPTMENSDTGRSQYQCPKIAPTMPKGITDITTRGRVQCAKIQVRVM